MAESGEHVGVEGVDFSSRNVSNIRNKKRRQELYSKLKFEQSKAKSKLKKAKRKLVKEKGKTSMFYVQLFFNNNITSFFLSIFNITSSFWPF